MGTGGNDLAVLLDGGLLEAVEIVEQGLPLRFQPFCFAQAGQFLGQRDPSWTVFGELLPKLDSVRRTFAERALPSS